LKPIVFPFPMPITTASYRRVPAVDFIMGHEVPHMSAVYRETISDDRLRAVADHVRT
jgi:hypothetical protein